MTTSLPAPYSTPVATPPVGRVADEPRACICIADDRGCLENAQVNDVLCRSCRLYHERPFGPNVKHPAPSVSDDPAQSAAPDAGRAADAPGPIPHQPCLRMERDRVTTSQTQRAAGFTAKPCPATCVDAWDDEYRCDMAKDHDGDHHDPEHGTWAAFDGGQADG